MLARRDVPRQQRAIENARRKQITEARRLAEGCQKEARARALRSHRELMRPGLKIKPLVKAMTVYWRKVEKEEAERQKQALKEAEEKRRRDEELRCAWWAHTNAQRWRKGDAASCFLCLNCSFANVAFIWVCLGRRSGSRSASTFCSHKPSCTRTLCIPKCKGGHLQ